MWVLRSYVLIWIIVAFPQKNSIMPPIQNKLPNVMLDNSRVRPTAPAKPPGLAQSSKDAEMGLAVWKERRKRFPPSTSLKLTSSGQLKLLRRFLNVPPSLTGLENRPNLLWPSKNYRRNLHRKSCSSKLPLKQNALWSFDRSSRPESVAPPKQRQIWRSVPPLSLASKLPSSLWPTGQKVHPETPSESNYAPPLRNTWSRTRPLHHPCCAVDG